MGSGTGGQAAGEACEWAVSLGRQAVTVSYWEIFTAFWMKLSRPTLSS